jgi:hypothetical protein
VLRRRPHQIRASRPVSAITVGLRGRVPSTSRRWRRRGAGAFSDDGSWVADDEVARAAFRAAGAHDWLVMEHCEDFGITGAGLLHDAPEVRAAGIPGIPRTAEDRATARDLALAREFGARLHLCHVSTAGAVALLASAKAAGLRVSGEVTPHHLVLTVADAVRGGVDFKMKPPLREASDVAALVRGLEDGTIDAIGTDHAPHAEAKKAQGPRARPSAPSGWRRRFRCSTRTWSSPAPLLRRLVEALVTGPARVAGRARRRWPGARAHRRDRRSTERPSTGRLRSRAGTAVPRHVAARLAPLDDRRRPDGGAPGVRQGASRRGPRPRAGGRRSSARARRRQGTGGRRWRWVRRFAGDGGFAGRMGRLQPPRGQAGGTGRPCDSAQSQAAGGEAGGKADSQLNVSSEFAVG